MERGSVRMSSSCMQKVRLGMHLKSKRKTPSSVTRGGFQQTLGNAVKDIGIENDESNAKKGAAVVGKKVMVVVDMKLQAKTALQWALSHALQVGDTLVLVSILKPFKTAGLGSPKRINSRCYRMLHDMKTLCHERRPEIKVEILLTEGEERGAAIVREAKKQEVSVLVLGQRKRALAWRFLLRLAGSCIKGNNMVDYCIQNANCMAVAVRRKSNAGNGYLITTKNRKDFWLLA